MVKISRLGLVALLAAVLLVLGNNMPVISAESADSETSNQYIVKAGDDLWTIGLRFGVTAEQIAKASGLDVSAPLQVGETLVIPDTKTYRVKAGENLSSIAAQNGISLTQLIHANQVSDPNRLLAGQVLYLPLSAKQTGRTTTAFEPSTQIAFDWPVTGPITSPFGPRESEFHEGIDIAANMGTDITAPRDGTVIFTGWISGYGNTVEIDHGNGYTTLYGHTSKILVQQGEHVSAGQVIAQVGSTGRSTGPHLHFEVRYNGKALNPLNYLRGSTVAATM